MSGIHVRSSMPGRAAGSGLGTRGVREWACSPCPPSTCGGRPRHVPAATSALQGVTLSPEK